MSIFSELSFKHSLSFCQQTISCKFLLIRKVNIMFLERERETKPGRKYRGEIVIRWETGVERKWKIEREREWMRKQSHSAKS